MSSSKVIKGGETAFKIHSFDPETVEYPAPEPRAEPKPGAVQLPSGPPASLPSPGIDPGETETEEERISRLEREAYEKGFEQGRKDGLELEAKQLQQQKQRMEALFAEIQGLKSSIFKEAEQELVFLSTLIAKRIVGEEIRSDPGVIRRTVQRAMELVSDRSRLKISVNPEDMDEMQRIMPELASMTKGGQLQVVEDETIERGGCLLETGFGRINATINEQLKMVERELDRAFYDPDPENQ
jgi:flagellar assembly protein FliH